MGIGRFVGRTVVSRGECEGRDEAGIFRSGVIVPKPNAWLAAAS